MFHDIDHLGIIEVFSCPGLKQKHRRSHGETLLEKTANTGERNLAGRSAGRSSERWVRGIGHYSYMCANRISMQDKSCRESIEVLQHSHIVDRPAADEIAA